MDSSFAEAMIHRSTHVVLGHRLRPFCLWHLLVLQQVASPMFGVTERGITPGDLAQAVAICRSRYGETQTAKSCDLPAIWAFLRRGLSRELEAFRAYVRDYQGHPEYTIIPPQGSSCSPERGQPPELLRIVTEVMAIARCSRREAWEMPEGEARWWYAMALRAKGADLDFMTTEERTRQQLIADEAPELAARMRAVAEQLKTRKTHPPTPDEDNG